MNKAFDVASFTWVRVRRLYDADAAVRRQRCEAEGFEKEFSEVALRLVRVDRGWR
jgi:hypothetical protein